MMVCLAVLYIAQEAPFLGVVQVVVYTGAVMMLFLFVLMLVGVDSSDSLVETIRGQRLAAAAARHRLRRRCSIARDRRRRPSRQPSACGEAERRRQRHGAGQPDLRRLRLRVRGDQRAADHRRARRDGADPPRAARRRGRPSASCPSRAVPRRRDHARRCPAPGVYARHNAVDTPALLPDGTPAELSVSRVLRARGQNRSISARRRRRASRPSSRDRATRARRRTRATTRQRPTASRDGGAPSEPDVYLCGAAVLDRRRRRCWSAATRSSSSWASS